jgi:hypothetical protein
MKLQHVLEAKYAFRNYVDEIRQIIDADTGASENIPIPYNEIDDILEQLREAFGTELYYEEPEAALDDPDPYEIGRAAWQLWDQANQRWDISISYYPPKRRAFIWVRKNTYKNLGEAQQVADPIPGELKQKILSTDKKFLRRGIQHPTKLKTIPYDEWIKMNADVIADLYDEVSRAIQDEENWYDWADDFGTLKEFKPNPREYKSEPSSRMMEHMYLNQRLELVKIIFDYLKDIL